MKRLLQIAGQRKGLLFTSCILAVLHSVLSLVPYALVFYIIKEPIKRVPDFSLTYSYASYAIGELLFFFPFRCSLAYSCLQYPLSATQNPH